MYFAISFFAVAGLSSFFRRLACPLADDFSSRSEITLCRFLRVGCSFVGLGLFAGFGFGMARGWFAGLFLESVSHRLQPRIQSFSDFLKFGCVPQRPDAQIEFHLIDSPLRSVNRFSKRQ